MQHQFSQVNPQVYFVIKERQQQYQQQQQQQQQYQQQYQQYPQQQQQYQQQQYQASPPGSPYNNSPHGSFGGAQQPEDSESLKKQLNTVREELKKLESQNATLDQKSAQINTEIQNIDKKLIQVQAFAGNYPQGTKENFTNQKQQFSVALQKISQAKLMLDDKERKYLKLVEMLENRIANAEQNEKDISKAEKLQQASSLVFEADSESENQIVVPEFITSQLNSLLPQFGVNDPYNYPFIEQILFILQQSQCPLDKSLRLVLHLATDPTNREKLPKTRILPILLQYLQYNDLDLSLRKSIIALLSNMTCTSECCVSMVKAGIIPVLISHLESRHDDAIIDSCLSILTKVFIDDMFIAIFQHHNGSKCLIDFFTHGNSQQKMQALFIFSIIGFSDEEDASEFINGANNISSICDIIDHEEKENIREMAIRIIISLSKLSPVSMIESNCIGRVINLISSKTENISLLIIALDSIAGLLINPYIRKTVYQRCLNELIEFADSSNEQLQTKSLSVLAGILDDETMDDDYDNDDDDDENENGLLSSESPIVTLNLIPKLVSIFCSTTTESQNIESILKILSFTGFYSSEIQLEFVTQGGIEIAITFLLSDDNNQILSSLKLLSQLNDHYNTIFNHSKRVKLIISHLKEKIENRDFVYDFLKSFYQFCTCDDISIISLFVECDIFATLCQLLSHFDDLIVLLCLDIIGFLCSFTICAKEFIRFKCSLLFIKLISSSNSEIRSKTLQCISKIILLSNEIYIDLIQNKIGFTLSEIESKEKTQSFLQFLFSISDDYYFQNQIRDSKLLDQILRHLRSKDLEFLQILIELVGKISNNNLKIIESMFTQGSIIQIIRLCERFLLRAKLQVTNPLISIIDKTLQILLNVSISSIARFYLMNKCDFKVYLKKFSTLNDSNLKQTCSRLHRLVNYPSYTNEEEKEISSSFIISQNILHSIENLKFKISSIPNDFLNNGLFFDCWNRDKLIQFIHNEINQLDQLKNQSRF